MINRNRLSLVIFQVAVILLSITSSHRVDAQNLSADSIKSRFVRFGQTHFQEKVYVHTDRDMYVSGEIMWFKVYQVGGYSNRPVDFSKITYAEIIDENNNAILQGKIAIEGGTGTGSFQLPAALPTGRYLFRAYTNWMKNSDPDYFFRKSITVVNTLLKPEKSSVMSEKTADVQFFPEGGDLVAGLTSIVGFRAVNPDGKGINVTGAVVGSAGDTVVNFRSFKYGIGSFNFTPQTGQHYKAVIRLPGGQILEKELPGAKTDGIVISLKETSDPKIELMISGAGNIAPDLYVLAHTRQETKFSEKVRLTSGSARISIDKALFGDGISHITVFNPTGIPVAERLFFKKSVANLAFSIKPTHNEIGKRRKMTVEFDAASSQALSGPINASVAVYATGTTGTNYETDITNYLQLQSDLKGVIEDPGYYFSKNDAETNTALDNLMLTHGWRRFVWNEIISGRSAKFTYVPELEGQVFSGKVIDTRSNQPARNVISYLSVPGKKFQLYPARSNESGEVNYYTKSIYGPAEIVLQTNTMIDSTYRVDLNNPYFAGAGPTELPRSGVSEDLREQILTQSVSAQVQNAFLSTKIRTFYKAFPDSAAFYDKPDKRYLLDNFVRFNTMEEVLREYVAEVPVVRRRDEFTLLASVKPHYNMSYKNVDPLLVFDGVPVFDTGTKMVRYDPKKIRTIDAVTQKYFLGPASFNSIIDFRSYKNNLPDFALDKRATVLDYDGLQLQREFYAPVYDTDARLADRMPDFRTLLFWEPNLKIDQSGKASVGFYTSDQTGNYRVVIQGINNEGMSGSGSAWFEVK